MIKLKLLYRAVKDLKSGRNMGDAVVLKAHALGSRCAPRWRPSSKACAATCRPSIYRP